MALTVLCAAWGFLLGTAVAVGPVPRTTWNQQEIHLKQFQEPGIFNYSTLLLSEDTNVLYIGAREAIFALNSLDVSDKQGEVKWGVSEEKQKECSRKGKSIQTECLNYVRVLQPLNSSVLYVCGTNAFQPTCNYLSVSPFQMVGKSEDGKGRCPFDPAHSYTSVMVDGDLYSGTSFTFLGSEPIILRHSHQGQLRTEYAVPWLNEPRFVHSEVIRENASQSGDDDKVYFFFTEVSVEYEFVNRLLIPRIARVCKNDHGGLRTLQKKWTSFLKAKLICSIPEKHLVFNIVNDVFILKPPHSVEPVIYGVFTSQLNNVGLSAVCAYNISMVEDVFAKGKYMHSTTVEQSHTKWVQYNGEIPSPRPGACINAQARAMNYSTSLDLPDKTLQFVKDHPLMNDLVTPMGNKPRLVQQNVKYTQIVVDRVKALDNNLYDVMFISTDKGTLHKAVNYANEMFIIEEIELFANSEPVQTLILSSKKDKRYLYAGSNTGVVQSPVAFCEKYGSCVDCVLARDPYCAWKQDANSCVHIPESGDNDKALVQKLNGDASSCLGEHKGIELHHKLTLGSSVKLMCSQKSNLATVFWKFQSNRLNTEGPKYYLLGEALFIFNATELDMGVYMCLSEEDVMNVKYPQVLAKHVLELRKLPQTTTTVAPTHTATQTEGNNDTPKMSTVGTERPTTHTSISPTQRPSTTTIITNPTFHDLTSTVSITQIFSAPPEIRLEKTLYLTNTNDNPLFTYLFVFFFVLFMCLLTYNCYKGFLPEHCLKYRSAILPGKAKAVSDFVDCEPGLKENLVEQKNNQNQNGEQPKASRDTGYETETECGNGKILHKPETETIEEDDSERPFDVNCELKFADSDVEGD